MQPPLHLRPTPSSPPSSPLLSHQSVRAEGWEYVVDHCPDASYILKPPAIIYIMSLLPLLAAPRPHHTTIHACTCISARTHTQVHTDALTDNYSHKQWHTMTRGDIKTDSLVTYAGKQRRAVCLHRHKRTHADTHTLSERFEWSRSLLTPPFAPHSIPVFMSEPDSSSQSLRPFLIFSFLSDLFSSSPSCLRWSDIIRIGLKPGKAHKDLFASQPCFSTPPGRGILPLSNGWSSVLSRLGPWEWQCANNYIYMDKYTNR